MAVLQGYLQKFGLDALVKDYGVKVRFHPELPHLALLCYDQINSPKNAVTNECRGVIVDTSKNFEFVCRPMDRFFNLGEGHAYPLDIMHSALYEKLDGTLCNMWFYNGKWYVSTKGSPDASGESWDSGQRFADMFWQVIPKDFYVEVDNNDFYKECTWCFELIGPQTKVVCKYDKLELVLLTARHNKTGQEFLLQHKDLRAPKVMLAHDSFPDLDSMIRWFNAQNPLELEGCVATQVVDGKVQRVKIKNALYVELHHTRGSLTPESLFTLVLTGEREEFVTKFPEYKDQLEEIDDNLKSLCDWVDIVAESYLRRFPRKKDLAFAVKDFPFKAFVFKWADKGKTPCREEWIKLSTRNRSKAFELYEVSKNEGLVEK